MRWGGYSSCDQVANVLDYDIVVSKFEPQLHYFISGINTLQRGMNPFIHPHDLNSTISVFLKGWIWHLLTHEGWYAIKLAKT